MVMPPKSPNHWIRMFVVVVAHTPATLGGPTNLADVGGSWTPKVARVSHRVVYLCVMMVDAKIADMFGFTT